MSGSKKVFTTLGSSNHVPEEREAFDYYATDPRAVEMLLELEQFSPVIWKRACEATETAYFDLLAEGCSPQEARSVLPNSLKTEVVMTANIRE